MTALVAGHHLKLLQGASELFDAMVQAMNASRFEIRLETYIFDVTASAQTIAQALIMAARRGVSVQLMVDGVGTPCLPVEWQNQFDEAGVRWHIFSPLGRLGLLIPNRWRRLHRKLCVVDGLTAFCGGINILDDLYDPNHGPLPSPRLDFAVQVTGPLVQDVHAVTSRLWWRTQAASSMRERDLATAWNALREAQQVESAPAVSGIKRGARAALILRDNIQHRRHIERAYLKAIAEAQHEIIIANAYFLPGGRLRRALSHAARRGVNVQILLQGRYEYFMQYHGARPVYGSLMAAGVQIHEYESSFLHAKVAVIDAGHSHHWATVGSSNLDPLSLLLAREANVVIQDQVFASELRYRLVQAMMSGSRRVESEELLRRTWSKRVKGWMAYGLMRLALFLTGKRY